ncbi:hypothetical protein JWG42_18960, partial [Desulfoprunum benzoelyticum]|uniref:hypothetical protein n=1 Tax=Desulfoprunum benzoelyticum TaxID=1506996 RepID=UPI001964E0DF
MENNIRIPWFSLPEPQVHLFERKWNFSSMIPILAVPHVFFILGCASFSCAADVSWSKGDRAHVVVIHGSAVSIESGYV